MLVELVRNGLVERTHTASVVVLAPDGSVRVDLGRVDGPIYPRSVFPPRVDRPAPGTGRA